MDKEIKAALLIQRFSGLTSGMQKRLLEHLGSFAAILDAPTTSLKAIIPERAFAQFTQLASGSQSHKNWLDEQCRLFEQNNVSVLAITSAEYPKLLKEINAAPELLFVRGDPDVLHLPQVAIVGSRRPTAPGADTAKSFARFLAGNGFVITSGLALGIDANAHQGALVSGKTIAVMGCGIDRLYPRQHHGLANMIIEQGGAIVSEFLPGTPPKASNFPRRNRIISGLSVGTLVVEAAIKSGSLITAKTAMNQGREVFAIPGSIHNPVSRGCHHLIKLGAKLVETADDIVEELGGLLSYKYQEANLPEALTLSSEEQRLLETIGFDPVDIDTLVERTGLSVIELNQQLVMLELNGHIDNQSGLFMRRFTG